ncbi:MAG TPA: DNA-directed RNA polymerase subunit omega [Fimbriimonadaceae bacterium]|jgi:DNA-directed RNA polymerase subunit omega
MLPSPDILNDFEHGKFVLSNLAAKRAKQLREGAPPLVQIDSHHPLTIALAEIAAGRIKPILPTAAELAQIEEAAEMSYITDEPLPAELGMLLPALDETEVALVTGSALTDDEHEVDLDHDETVPVSLTDLVEDEEDVAPAVADEDTLSLSDIAEQETLDDEESEE